MGGGAAWLAGRAIAATWRPWWHVALYMLPLSLAVRFLHFALFDAKFLSLHYYLVDFAVCLGFGFLGFRLMRVAQMVTRYSWINERTGWFRWRRRDQYDRREIRQNPGDISPICGLNPVHEADQARRRNSASQVSHSEVDTMRQWLTLGLAFGLGLAFADTASAQIKMGVAGPLTGGSAAFGAQLKNGTEQAVGRHQRRRRHPRPEDHN